MEVELTLEQAIEIASKRILLPGYKPEDYFFVSEKVPLKIAAMIVLDAQHLLRMSKR